MATRAREGKPSGGLAAFCTMEFLRKREAALLGRLGRHGGVLVGGRQRGEMAVYGKP